MVNSLEKSKVKSILAIIFGTFITAMGIELFLLPNKIVGGGVSGLSTILYHTIKIPSSVSFAIINIVLLLIGFKVLGWRFVLKTILGVGALSVFMELLSYLPSATDNLFLATCFGSILYGAGIGITLVFNASTGGTDILGRLIQTKFPHFPIGKILLFVDGVIIAVSFCLFREIELTLFGIISLVISTFTIDYIMKILNISKLAFIISEKGEEITKLLISTSPRGVTMIDVKGGYTMEDKKMLVCALKNGEMPEFQRKIKEVDNDAFVIYSESQQIVGNGFYVYK